jgi:putative flippase GtrA
MNPLYRFVRFNAVGLIGAGVQLTTIAGLVHGYGLDYRISTATALAATLLHNFIWHARWTWVDRQLRGRSRAAAFVRFVLGNGSVSIAGNAVLMPLLVELVDLPVVAANAVAIATCGVINFWLADRAFTDSFRIAARRRSRPGAGGPLRSAARPSKLTIPAPDRPESTPAASSAAWV